MKRKSNPLILLTGLWVMVLFTGLVSKRFTTGNLISYAKEAPKELLETGYGDENQTAAAVAAGANDFAFQLSAALAGTSGDENLVCSPYSVWIPLAALVSATDEPYRAELLDALNASGISDTDINNASSRMLYDLTKQRQKNSVNSDFYPYHNPLQIANAIFVDHNVTLKKDFARNFADYFRGTAMNVDFGSDDAVVAVNQWASDHTEGLITEIVQNFDANTVAALANAIYFSNRWDREFDVNQTTEDIFYSPAGDTKAYYMRREGDEQIYYEDDKVQAISLNFKTGGRLCIILPADGDASKLMTTMTNEYYSRIQAGSAEATGTLLLPRFSAENRMELKDTLTALGVPLFDEEKAPLTGGLIEEEYPLWLSGAIHKAVIEVDEKGTTAAAVTVLTMEAAAEVIPTERFEMICNKPFVFVLSEDTYDGGQQVLFTGIINQP